VKTQLDSEFQMLEKREREMIIRTDKTK